MAMMEESLRAGRRSKPTSRSSSNGGSGSIEYTSLRDVLVEGGDHQLGAGGSWREYSCHDIHDFDASNIGIRNQLLKHATSAYVQSAVVVASCDQNCLARLWRQVQLRVGRGRVAGVRRRPRPPAELCVAFVADRIASIWA